MRLPCGCDTPVRVTGFPRSVMNRFRTSVHLGLPSTQGPHTRRSICNSPQPAEHPHSVPGLAGVTTSPQARQSAGVPGRDGVTTSPPTRTPAGPRGIRRTPRTPGGTRRSAPQARNATPGAPGQPPGLTPGDTDRKLGDPVHICRQCCWRRPQTSGRKPCKQAKAQNRPRNTSLKLRKTAAIRQHPGRRQTRSVHTGTRPYTSTPPHHWV